MVESSFHRHRKPIKPQETIRKLRQSHPKVFDSLLGFIFTVIMLLCVEGVFYVLNEIKHSPEVYTKHELLGYTSQPNVQVSAIEKKRFRFTQKDELLDYKLQPNVQVSEIKKKDGETVYNAIYTIDEYGRRVTPVKGLEHRSNFILFFVCSFTFGTGVNDDETMPFYVAQLASHYMPYNYGVGAYGPQHMLARLQSSEITKEINETRGMLIYTFIDTHVNRAIGTMNIHINRGDKMPFYTIDSNDRLVRKGNFVSGRPGLSFVYDVLNKSQIIKYIGVNFPRIRDDHIRIVARIIEESRNTFRDKFDSDDFYVLFYPGSTQYAKRIIPYLENVGIKYLDYSDLTNLRTRKFKIIGDGHPTARAHMTVAEKVVEDIGMVSSND
jgi:hypothetical protein